MVKKSDNKDQNAFKMQDQNMLEFHSIEMINLEKFTILNHFIILLDDPPVKW